MKTKNISRQKRKLAVLSCMLMFGLITACTGCQKKSANVSTDTVAKGRYVEQDFKLPELSEKETLVAMTSTKDGLPLLYSYILGDNSISITTYTYTSDGTITKDAPKWLQSMEFDTKYAPVLSYSMTSDGTQYFLVSECDYDYCHGSLYQTKDGVERTELTMKGWDKMLDNGNPSISPTKIGVLDNGTIVVDSYEGLYAFDQEGKKVKTIDENSTYASFFTHGNNLVCTIEDGGTEQFKGTAIFDGSNLDQEPVTNMFQNYQEYTNAVNMNATNDLIYVNSSGICLQKSGTELWQTILDGSLGTMYVPNVVGSSITEDADGNYYVMYDDYNSGQGSLIKYYYDPDISSVPDKELTVYTLNSSHTLRKTANQFQKSHPDVKVTIEVAMPEKEDETANTTLSKHDYIQSLNTQLLAGDGCDIINTVGLPVDSYIEKGALIDLSDLIDPLCTSGELVNNLVDACRVDNKIYSVPARFLLPAVYAPLEDCPDLTDISSIADYAKAHTDSILFGKYRLEDYLETILPYATKDLTTADGSIDVTALTSFLEDAKTIADQTGLVQDYSAEGYMNYPSCLSETGGLALTPMDGIADATLNYTYINAIGYGYSVLNNSFIPSVQLGINASSKQTDLAKEFISTLLSEEVQVVDMEDGFPVQSEALEKTSFNVEGTLPIYDANGNIKEVPLINITGDLRTNLINTIKGLNRVSSLDDAILEVMTDVSPDYFDGKMTLEDTVAQIQNKLSLYTEE